MNSPGSSVAAYNGLTMSNLSGFGIPFARRVTREEPKVSHVLLRHPLRRVLNFTGHTIDEVVNDPIVKNKVLGYFKLHKLVERRYEIVDLERQWNPLG